MRATMSVKELREALAQYDDNMAVELIAHSSVDNYGYEEVDAELFVNNKSFDTLMEYEG